MNDDHATTVNPMAIMLPRDFSPVMIRMVVGAESVRCYRDGRVIVLEYPPAATTAELQAALDSQDCHMRIVTEPYDEPTVPMKPRRPGPPPRAETARERNARWRREGR